MLRGESRAAFFYINIEVSRVPCACILLKAVRKMNSCVQGRNAEEEARNFLIREGWEIVSHNFRMRRGEIDIIAIRSGILAFIEVKCANRCTLEDLQHVVGAKKQRVIIETSKLFLAMNRKYNEHHIRYDVMLMQQNACVRYLEGAFAE
jgi:putative endonuclease